jgi:hypothetical protein
MAKRQITRADFARAARVSKAAVTKWLSGPGGAAAAGDGVDIDHPLALAFKAKHDARAARSAGAPPPPAKPAPAAPAAPPASAKPDRRRRPEPTAPPAAAAVTAPPRHGAPPPETDAAGYAPELAELTLAEIVLRHGTVPAYLDHLNAYSKREQALKTKLDNQRTQSELISFELVQTHLFGALESLSKRLLGDTAKTIVLRLTSHVKAGGSGEDAEKIVLDLISSQIKPVKETAARVLRNA